jgi:hypothetical protein
VASSIGLTGYRRRDDLCAVGLRKHASLFISLCIRDFD